MSMKETLYIWLVCIGAQAVQDINPNLTLSPPPVCVFLCRVNEGLWEFFFLMLKVSRVVLYLGPTQIQSKLNQKLKKMSIFS